MPENFDKILSDFAKEENGAVDFEAMRLRILEAHALETAKKKTARFSPATWRRFGLAAACLALCIAAGSIVGRSMMGQAEMAAPAAEAPAAPAAPAAASLESAEAKDKAEMEAAPAAAAPQPAPAAYAYTAEETAAEEAAPAAEPAAAPQGRRGEATASGAAPAENGSKATATTAVAYDPYVQLINRENLLTADYVPAGLVELDGFELPNVELKKEGMRADGGAAEALRSMLAAAEAEGVEGFYLASAYRSYDEQARLWARKVEQDPYYGENGEAVSTMPPGASEHQSGLAFDITSLEHPSMRESFAATEQGQWLAANAHEYGFILRYPEGKEALTGVVFEPWHFRYVGEWNAPALYESGVVMEEVYQP